MRNILIIIFAALALFALGACSMKHNPCNNPCSMK